MGHYLGKVAYYVVSSWIVFCHNIKQEWIGVVIEGLVIQEKFG